MYTISQGQILAIDSSPLPPAVKDFRPISTKENKHAIGPEQN